jgi:hypothetical protein
MGKNRKPPSPIGDLLPKPTYGIDRETARRASEAVWRQREEEYRRLGDVERMFAAEFAPLCPLTYFSMTPDIRDALRTYIFFKTDADIERAQREGLIDRMSAFVARALEDVGRGADAQIVLRLKSDESIRRVPGAYRDRRKECEIDGPGVWPDAVD